MNIKGHGHSLTFIQGHSDSIFSNFVCSETARPIEAKFHVQPPWNVGNENLFKCSRPHDHAHIWWKPSNIFFFRIKRPMTLKLGIQYWVLEFYQCFHMMTLGWLWPFFMTGKFVSECFCIGESLYSIECVCISKFILILHILSTQVSYAGPMVLWFIKSIIISLLCLSISFLLCLPLCKTQAFLH